MAYSLRLIPPSPSITTSRHVDFDSSSGAMVRSWIWFLLLDCIFLFISLLNLFSIWSGFLLKTLNLLQSYRGWEMVNWGVSILSGALNLFVLFDSLLILGDFDVFIWFGSKRCWILVWTHGFDGSKGIRYLGAINYRTNLKQKILCFKWLLDLFRFLPFTVDFLCWFEK